MSIVLSDENEDFLNNDNNNIKKLNNSYSNKIVKYFKGIWIYFKDYILFLKGSTFKVFRMMNYVTYHWGFQMILLIGMTQSYGVVNMMAHQFAPHLVNEGEIE